MKVGELKGRSKGELERLLQEKRERLRQLEFDLSQKKLKNVREISRMKKDIAQILTVMNLEFKK